MNATAAVFILVSTMASGEGIEVTVVNGQGARLKGCETVTIDIETRTKTASLEWDSSSESYKTTEITHLQNGDKYAVIATCGNRVYTSGLCTSLGKMVKFTVTVNDQGANRVPTSLNSSRYTAAQNDASCYCIPQPIICCDPCSPCCYPNYATASPVIYNSPVAVTSVWP